MELFAFTMKIIKINEAPELYWDLYSDVLTTWVTKFNCRLKKYVLETDSKKKLHVHGTIEIPKNLLRKKLCFSKNMHVCFRKIENETKWNAYIAKDLPCRLSEICKHEDECLMKRLKSKLF